MKLDFHMNTHTYVQLNDGTWLVKSLLLNLCWIVFLAFWFLKSHLGVNEAPPLKQNKQTTPPPPKKKQKKKLPTCCSTICLHSFVQSNKSAFTSKISVLIPLYVCRCYHFLLSVLPALCSSHITSLARMFLCTGVVWDTMQQSLPGDMKITEHAF